MGRPKAWLPLGDETLLQRIAGITLQVCPHVVVVASSGQSLPVLPPCVVRVDDADDLRGGGPLVGALGGMASSASLGEGIVYVGAVDAAWLSAAHVDAMLATLEQDATLRAVVPISQQGDRTIVHATSGALRLPAALATARRLVDDGERALKRLYEALDARTIDVAMLPEPDAVRPCNTPDDHAAAQRWIAGRA